jgi:hypothetical protein
MQIQYQCMICERIKGCDLTGRNAIRHCYTCGELDCVFDIVKPEKIIKTICSNCCVIETRLDGHA